MPPTILLFGTFDHFHPGHDFVIREALKRGNVTVVVARDANVEKIKGRLPDLGEEERRATIEHLFPSVHVILGDADDFLAPVRAIRPSRILLGYDQRLPPGITEETFASLGIAVERLAAFEPDKHKSSLRRDA